MPSVVTAGDLLVVVFHENASGAIAFPAGWTFVLNFIDAGVQRGAIYARIADGTEGASITVTTGATSVRCEYRSLRITGANVGSITLTTPVTGAVSAYASTNNPDPPNLDPADWGTEDTLWYAIEIGNDGTKTVTSYPTNYTNGVQHAASGGTPGQLAIARRNLNASSEDPGTFALSSGGGSRTAGITLAIRPAASAQTLIPSGRASTVSFGSQTVKGIMNLLPSSRASGLVLGAPIIKALNTLVPTAKSSSLTLGSHRLAPINTLIPSSRSSNLALGNPALTSMLTILPEGVHASVEVQDAFTDVFNTRLSDHIMTRGEVWNEPQGEWYIRNDNARRNVSQGDGHDVAVTEADRFNTTASVTIVSPDHGPTLEAGIVVNYVDNDNYWLFLLENAAVSIWEKTAGVFTNRSLIFHSFDPGGSVSYVAVVTNDDTIDAYLNGTLITSYYIVDRPNKEGTQFGLYQYVDDTLTTFDDFQVGADFLGSPTLSGTYTLLPDSRASSLALGNHTMHPFNTISPTTIAATSTLGNPTLLSMYKLIPNGIVSTLQIGQPAISSGGITIIQPNGRVSTTTLGNHTLYGFATMNVAGRASTLTLGAHTIKGLYTIQPDGRISTITIGSHRIYSSILLQPNGVPSLSSVGSASLLGAYVIAPTGKSSTIVLSNHRLMQPTVLIPNGILSTESLGLHRLFQVVFPGVCEPLELLISQTTPTGLLIASNGLSELQIVHVANVVLEVIKNDSELDLNPSTIAFLEVVCDGS
jgi:hypothetical protein